MSWLAFTLLVLFVVLVVWQGIRDSYDQERRRTEPYYPRYGATNWETLKWWWATPRNRR